MLRRHIDSDLKPHPWKVGLFLSNAIANESERSDEKQRERQSTHSDISHLFFRLPIYPSCLLSVQEDVGKAIK